MSLDEQLAELLGQLGVILEGPEGADAASQRATGENGDVGRAAIDDLNGDEYGEASAVLDGRDVGAALDLEAAALAEITLFQTSREHYGVFYRLDLVAGAPQLRVYAPDEQGALKMRCYLVRPSTQSPLRTWFTATRGHDGSAAYEELRETTEQHLLFAAGETLKRLFWSGEHDEMRFPTEISVHRLA